MLVPVQHSGYVAGVARFVVAKHVAVTRIVLGAMRTRSVGSRTCQVLKGLGENRVPQAKMDCGIRGALWSISCDKNGQLIPECGKPRGELRLTQRGHSWT